VIRNHLLYSTVIENDGRIGKEPTFLGVVLGMAAVAILILAAGYAIALFR
jgi:hypothetical protein